MLGIPWWGWLLVILLCLVLLVLAAWRSWRRTVRGEVVEFLRERYPGVEILDESDLFIAFRWGEVNGSGRLANVYNAVSGLRTDAPEARREVYEQWAESLIRGAELLSQPCSLETHGERLLPRLVRPDFLEDRPDGRLPHTPLESIGLAVVYVIDYGPGVAYVTESSMEELGLNVVSLHKRALENLAKISPGEELVAGVAAGESTALLKAGDSHDAARLLLIPRSLREGRAVAAVIPDRDTLGLAPVPPDNDWSGLMKLARTPESEHLLLDRPLRVTSEGFELVQPSGWKPTV